ncbi:MAG: hypothetical protein Q9187_005013, partial [Circinaria calcarea]
MIGVDSYNSVAASALLDQSAEAEIEGAEPLVKREPEAGVEATTCSTVVARVPPSLGGPANPCYVKAPANFFT